MPASSLKDIMALYLPQFISTATEIQDWADELAFWFHLNGLHERAYKFWKCAFWYRRTSSSAHDAEWCHNLELIGLKLQMKGRWKEAEDHFREALDYKEATLSHDDRKVYETLMRIARILVVQRRFEDAESYFRRALEGYTRILSKTRHEVLQVTSEFAYSLACQDIPRAVKEAESLVKDILKTRERILGKMHQQTVESVWMLGFVMEKAGQKGTAKYFYERAYEEGCNLLGKEHVDVRNYEVDCDRLNWEDGELVQYLTF